MCRLSYLSKHRRITTRESTSQVFSPRQERRPRFSATGVRHRHRESARLDPLLNLAERSTCLNHLNSGLKLLGARGRIQKCRQATEYRRPAWEQPRALADESEQARRTDLTSRSPAIVRLSSALSMFRFV